MEIRARYLLIGLFTLAVIAAGFGFVYWLHSGGGFGGEQTAYRIRFHNPVFGLRAGSPVLFNGIRVGEVTELSLDGADPRRVTATVMVARGTPVRADTYVTVDTQGLMGSPSVSLRGGAPDAPAPAAADGGAALLLADPAAGQDTMQAARQVLQRIDGVLADNSEALKSTIANLDKFSGALARNSDKVDGIVDGLAQMAAAGAAKAPLPVYDLSAVRKLPAIDKPAPGQIVVADPSAVITFDTQRILVQEGGEGARLLDKAQWSDTLPKLVQAKIVESFEGTSWRGAVSRPVDAVNADYQLVLDIRNFKIVAPPARADVELAARLVGEGRVIASRSFQAAAPAASLEPAAVVAALDEAFGTAAAELVLWTVQSVSGERPAASEAPGRSLR
jgi:phospholipid/cholesterol/gamma-HCH transport system substrate-binding protein